MSYNPSEARDSRGRWVAGQGADLDQHAKNLANVVKDVKRAKRRTRTEIEADAAKKVAVRAAKAQAREETARAKTTAKEAAKAKKAAERTEAKATNAAARKTVTAFKREGLDISSETAKAWNKHVGGMAPKEFAERMAGNSGVTVKWRSVAGDEDGGQLRAKFTLHDEKGRNIGSMDRNINFEDKSVEHSMLEIDGRHQNRGIARAMLSSQVSVWRELGNKSVTLFANIDVGAYAWARYGFKPTSMNAFREEMKEHGGTEHGGTDKINALPRRTQATFVKLLASNDTRAVWAMADHAQGKNVLLGAAWHGNLDLTDRRTMERFNAYTK